MKQSLYSITGNYFELMDELEELSRDEESQDVSRIAEIMSELDINQENFREKADNYAKMLKQYEAWNTGIDAEIKRLQALKKSNVSKAEQLESRLLNALPLYTENEKLQTELFKFSTRKSESIEIDTSLNLQDLSLQYPDLVQEVTEYKPDKRKLKKFLQEGCVIGGICIKENKSLNIK